MSGQLHQMKLISGKSALNNFMSFQIINIILPNSKESVRFPSKNRYLRDYTLEWLDKEIPSIETGDKIAIVWELRNKNVPVDTDGDKQYSFKIHPLWIPDQYSNDMKPLLKYAEKHIKGDVNILLQYTQPARREGLLKDLYESVINSPKKLTVTYAETPLEGWRVIHDNNWSEHFRNTREGRYVKMYDGAGYAWSSDIGSKCLWQHKKKKNCIVNHSYVINIDYPEEYNKFIELNELRKNGMRTDN